VGYNSESEEIQVSEYRKSTTNCRDREVLIDALVEMGYKRENIEYHEVPQQLYDWHGRPTTYTDKNGDKANIIVRRQHVGGAANDLGFKLEADGNYAAVISQYDSGKHNTKWLSGLKTSYSDKRVKKELAKNGFKHLGKEMVNGKIQIRYLKMTATL
jgi:hypothetical protein